MAFLLMYNLKFSESASKKFAGPPKFGQNQIGESTVAPLKGKYSLNNNRLQCLKTAAIKR